MFSSVSLESKMRETYLARKQLQGFFGAAQAGNNELFSVVYSKIAHLRVRGGCNSAEPPRTRVDVK